MGNVLRCTYRTDMIDIVVLHSIYTRFRPTTHNVHMVLKLCRNRVCIHMRNERHGMIRKRRRQDVKKSIPSRRIHGHTRFIKCTRVDTRFILLQGQLRKG